VFKWIKRLTVSRDVRDEPPLSHMRKQIEKIVLSLINQFLAAGEGRRVGVCNGYKIFVRSGSVSGRSR
jgi:hypothetical protein